MSAKEVAHAVVGKAAWSSLSERARQDKIAIVQKYIDEQDREIEHKLSVMIEAVDALTCEGIE